MPYYEHDEYCPHCFRDLVDKSHIVVDGYGQESYPYRLDTIVQILGMQEQYMKDDEHNGGCGWAWHSVPKTPRYKSERERVQPFIDKNNEAVLQNEKKETSLESM
jgi:hypothetical protein